MAVRGRKAKTRTAKLRGSRAREAASTKAAPAKSRLRKTFAGKSKAPAGKTKPPATSAQAEIARLKRDLHVARDRRIASAEILRTIAAAPGDASRSLQQIAETTERLFAASAVSIRIAGDGDAWSHIVNVGAGAKLIAATVSADQLRIGGHNMPSTVYLENRLVHLPDLENVDPAVAAWPGLKPSLAAGTRTLVGIPLRREGKAIGAMIVHRKRVAAFTDDELALLQSFADQAVIAIENARSFNETQEALERQKASADILSVISRSPTDLRPVFNAIVVTAARLLRCDMAFVLRCDAATYTSQAIATRDGLLDDPGPANVSIDPEANFPSRTIVEKKILHLPDWSAIELPEHQLRVQKTYGVNSSLFVPFLRGQDCIGLLALGRKRAGAFSKNDISIAQSFADQALIAIENARLFQETSESLQQQTATADVLKLISRSTFDLQPVLDKLVRTAAEICDAEMAFIYRREGDFYRTAAAIGMTPEYERHMETQKIVPGRGTMTGRAILEGRAIHIENLAADPEYTLQETITLGKVRTALAIPLLREADPIGVFTLARSEVRPFTEKQIELVTTFADQAVIAIENTRLLTGQREALQQQTATADVLKIISDSPGTLEPVFGAILENAVRLCEAKFGNLFLIEGLDARWAAGVGTPPALLQHLQSPSFRPTPGSHLDRVMHTRRVSPSVDDAAEPVVGVSARLGGARSTICVPMVKDDALVGAIFMYRTEVRPFTDKQIKLVESFAAHAVIAVQNARLFNETREALERQTATAEILKVIASSPTDVDPVLETIVERARELCEANDAAVLLKEADHLRFSAHRGPIAINVEKWPINRGWASGRAVLERMPVHVPDTLSAEEYPDSRELSRHSGTIIRSVLAVPLLREGEAVGSILLRRIEVRPFSDKQIALLQTFADQAVIAIENVRLFNETREALERQTATADILKVIASSPTDVKPVFDAIAERSNQLLNGYSTAVMRFDGEMLDLAAFTSTNPEGDAALRAAFPQPVTNFPPFQLVRGGETVQFADTEAAGVPELNRELARARGYRSMLHTALMGDRGAIGMISVTREEPGSFAPHHVQLLRTFADQAVIAIQNVRLFDEVQARTRDVQQALEHQTATAEVLQVISGSMADARPVFERIVDSIQRLIECRQIAIFLAPGDGLVHMAARRGINMALLDTLYPQPVEQSAVPAVIEARRQVFYPDVLNGENVPVTLRRGAQLSGNFADLLTPMLWEGRGVGMIAVTREPNVGFSDKEKSLLRTFADQAVIAIENARLFTETREALQQQTATAEVLSVISASPGDLAPVFDAMLGKAMDLCGADFGVLNTFDGEKFHTAATRGLPPAYEAFRRIQPLDYGSGTAAARLLRGESVVEITDLVDSDAYRSGESNRRALVDLGGARCLLTVALLKDERVVGNVMIFRQEKRRFSDKQIALLKQFAAQAVIAIENARLLHELRASTDDLRESLQQQTATADVLKVISRSAFDLDAVMNTLTQSAAELCKAELSALYLRDGDFLLARGMAGVDGPRMDFLRETPLRIDNSAAGDALAAGAVLNIADVEREGAATTRKFGQALGFKSILFVPLMREGRGIGVFALGRKRTGEYSQREIELLQTFADQAVIAIENSRLFEEVQARTRELTQSLDELRTAQDRLVQTEKLASLGQLTAGIAHEIKNPLNFVNNFSALSSELIDELLDVLKPAELAGNIRQEVDELSHMLKDNLDKVVQHGKRADSIVKNMLLHSRAGAGERRAVEINGIVEESLNLAYHGARAEKTGFNITLKRDFDPDAGLADVFPQEIARVFLNLISNGFYAAAKRAAEAGDGFEPTLSASTKNLGDRIEIRIRDNGTGIPADVKDKMFNPFFTTKPAGEGTGLGLSISHDIIVKQHGGTIDVATEPGAYTEFTITLPRANAGE